MYIGLSIASVYLLLPPYFSENKDYHHPHPQPEGRCPGWCGCHGGRYHRGCRRQGASTAHLLRSDDRRLGGRRRRFARVYSIPAEQAASTKTARPFFIPLCSHARSRSSHVFEVVHHRHSGVRDSAIQPQSRREYRLYNWCLRASSGYAIQDNKT